MCNVYNIYIYIFFIAIFLDLANGNGFIYDFLFTTALQKYTICEIFLFWIRRAGAEC